jgi:hypothetical protein
MKILKYDNNICPRTEDRSIYGPVTESQIQNLALTILFVPNSIDGGPPAGESPRRAGPHRRLSTVP